MPRIAPIGPEDPLHGSNLKLIVGRVTNMKTTLARSRPALEALLQWYPLHDAVLPYLGERGVSLFCHAISTQSDCLICSTYFRRDLIDAGEDPDHLRLSSREQLLIEFGRQVALDANNVDDDLFRRLQAAFSDDQIVELTAFAAMMVATNVFNNAIRVDLDESLYVYRAEAGAASSG